MADRDERREARSREDREAPPPTRRKKVSPEAIAVGGSSAATAWATVSEFLPALPKAVAGVVLGAVATWGSLKAYKARSHNDGGSVEDR